MPTMILRQPDGKLAAFSSVVDDFVMWDADETEAVRYCVEVLDMGPKSAAEKVRRGIEDHQPYMHGVRGDGTSRWRNALENLALQQGRARLAEVLATLGFPDYDLGTLDLRGCDEREAAIAAQTSSRQPEF